MDKKLQNFIAAYGCEGWKMLVDYSLNSLPDSPLKREANKFLNLLQEALTEYANNHKNEIWPHSPTLKEIWDSSKGVITDKDYLNFCDFLSKETRKSLLGIARIFPQIWDMTPKQATEFVSKWVYEVKAREGNDYFIELERYE